jgi:hypothetical protein
MSPTAGTFEEEIRDSEGNKIPEYPLFCHGDHGDFGKIFMVSLRP